MARKKSKLNFLDSLLGGLAQGFQLSQQFKGDKQKSELDERKLSIQEQKLDLQQQQFDLDQEATKKFQRLFGGGGQALNRLPALNAPSPIVSAPSTLTPTQLTPSATTAVAPTLPGIAEFPTELPTGGRVAPALPTAPIVQPGPSEIPFPTDTFAQPTQAPPAPEVLAPEQPAEDQARTFIIDFAQQLQRSMANPKEPTTVTANFGGAGSVTKIFDKNATPNQHFMHFVEQVKKNFPTATPADLAEFLRGNTLRDVPAAKLFFEREFNSAVNREFRFLKAQSEGPLTTRKTNELKGNAINETVKNFSGYVSSRHEKQFQEATLDNFDPSSAIELEFIRAGILDRNQLFQLVQDDPTKATAVIDAASIATNNLQSSETTFKTTTDGRVFATSHTRDREGREKFDITEVFKGKKLDFTPKRIVAQSAIELANRAAVGKATETIQGIDEIHSTINALAKLTRNKDGTPMSDEQLNASLGFAGGFNRFTVTLFDQLRGLADSSTLPGAAGIGQMIGQFRKSTFFNKTIAERGEQMQRFAIGYITLILKTAKMIGLGEARAISDKDFDRVQSAISASGSTTLRATLSFLNKQANTTRKNAVGVRQNPDRAFAPRDPNPDPFGPDAVDPQERSFLTPNFFGKEPKTKEEALSKVDELIKRGGGN